ncbi:MAG: hypothetical protein LBQ54_12465 [Planctomycetaceae bacterium]|jgi:hypothetical protein|nr:hypothetical protein [Planctomycetaceae bacterium]
MKNKLVLFGLTIFIAVWTIGCNDAKMGYVTGKVLIDGEPAPKGLTVRFHPQLPGSSFSTGVTDENGNYEMHFSLTKKGVQTGSCRITIDNPEGDGAVRVVNIPVSYREGTDLLYDVKPGRQNYNIEISLKNK